jgi:hypothetical protein
MRGPSLGRIFVLFVVCALFPWRLHSRPDAVRCGPELGLSHGADSHRAHAVLLLVDVIKSHDIRPGGAATLKIDGATIIEGDLVHKVLNRSARRHSLTTDDFHVGRQDEPWLSCIEVAVSVQINI